MFDRVGIELEGLLLVPSFIRSSVAQLENGISTFW